LRNKEERVSIELIAYILMDQAFFWLNLYFSLLLIHVMKQFWFFSSEISTSAFPILILSFYFASFEEEEY